MSLKDKVNKDVIDLVLRYDLLEDRAIKWRKENNLKIKASSLNKVKFYFYYEDDENTARESVFTSKNYADAVKKRIRRLLKIYPKLRCCTDRLKCCGANNTSLMRVSNGIVNVCMECGYEFKVTTKENQIMSLSNRKATITYYKIFRQSAVIVWESK